MEYLVKIEISRALIVSRISACQNDVILQLPNVFSLHLSF